MSYLSLNALKRNSLLKINFISYQKYSVYLPWQIYISQDSIINFGNQNNCIRQFMVNAAYSVIALNFLDYTQDPSPATVDRRWKRAIKFRGTALRLLTKFCTQMMIRFGNYNFLLL